MLEKFLKGCVVVVGDVSASRISVDPPPEVATEATLDRNLI